MVLYYSVMTFCDDKLGLCSGGAHDRHIHATNF